jgi:diaminohydroxyphosphoribosylaminopyrimidine deaminase/5-amino-6-(5-phosphoribosylamino)uracil reductase
MPDARRYLDMAARLAMRGAGDVEPNPTVGCVLVSGGAVIGMGHHTRFGGAHAEREALDDARRRGHDPRGCTVYVTLEPCGHHGKTPPCTDALIEAGVGRVVYARRDPGEASRGGAGLLAGAGIPSEQRTDSDLAMQVGEAFAKRTLTGLPWVIAKWAQTMDGRLATRLGDSKWISGPMSRRRVHRLRARVDAIITGLGTVLADDPMLTARGVRRVRRVARRVVIDSGLDMPLGCRLVGTARDAPTLVVCAAENATAAITEPKRQMLERAGVAVVGAPCVNPGAPGHLDLGAVLRRLREQHGVHTAMLEAGPGLLGAMIEADLVDEAIIYVAPLLLGDELARGVVRGRVVDSLTAGKRWRLVRLRRCEQDVELTYRRAGTVGEP